MNISMRETVKTINEAISNALKGCKLSIRGIAEIVPISPNGKAPALVENSGECQTDLFDDKYDVGIYHRVFANGYSTANAGGVGDYPKATRQTNMSIVVCGKRKIYDQFDLENLLASILLRNNCKPTETSFDRNEVFSSEFAGVEFFIKPDYFLFRIKYSINKPMQLSCYKLTTK